MGIIDSLIGGSGAVAQLGRAAQGVSEVFVPNATAGQALSHAAHRAALDQLGAEFALPRRGRFDRFVDGLNRLPRPMLALGTLGLFVSAMTNPVWFAQRMQGVALVPEPLWWLMGAIVSFYFGARHQAKTHDLHKSLAVTLARAPEVIRQIDTLEREPSDDVPLVLEADHATETRFADNAALEDWRASRER